MVRWTRRFVLLGFVGYFHFACVVLEDFEGYGPLEQETTCDPAECTNSSSSSSSGTGLNPPVPPGSSSSSSSSSSASSSSTAGGPLEATVVCGGIPCPVIEGMNGCCYADSSNMTCESTANCGMRPIFYCDGREDCNGSPCCFSNNVARCSADCAGSRLCMSDLDCQVGKHCNPNAYGDIGICSP